MNEKITQLAKKLEPFTVKLIENYNQESSLNLSGGSGSSSGVPSPHDLSGEHHTGTLADSQAPQFLMTDGSRQLTGDLSVAPGIEIDGVDIGLLEEQFNQHLVDPAAHPYYARKAADEIITGNWTFAAQATFDPGAVAPFVIGADAQGQKVVGLNADSLHGLNPSDDPGTASFVLNTNASGEVTIQKILTPEIDSDPVGGSVTLNAGADVILSPTADVLLIPSGIISIGADVEFSSAWAIGTDNYVSESIGWNVDYAGNADFRNIFSDEIRTRAFIADIEQALAGGEIVSKSTAILFNNFFVPLENEPIGNVSTVANRFVLSNPDFIEKGVKTGDTIEVSGSTGNDGTYTVIDVTGSSSCIIHVSEDVTDGTADGNITVTQTHLTVEDLPGFPGIAAFSDNDWIRMRVIDRSGGGLVVADVWGTVVNYTDNADGTQDWDYNPQDNGGVTNQPVYEGAVVVDYGQSGDGYWQVDAIGDNPPNSDVPYTQIQTWVTDPSVSGNHTLRTRLGNLAGVTDADLSPTGWGLYSDNAFLKGSLVAGSGGEVTINDTGINIEMASTLLGGVSTSIDFLNIGGSTSLMDITASDQNPEYWGRMELRSEDVSNAETHLALNVSATDGAISEQAQFILNAYTGSGLTQAFFNGIDTVSINDGGNLVLDGGGLLDVRGGDITQTPSGGGSANLIFDASSNQLGIRTAFPVVDLQINDVVTNYLKDSATNVMINDDGNARLQLISGEQGNWQSVISLVSVQGVNDSDVWGIGASAAAQDSALYFTFFNANTNNYNTVNDGSPIMVLKPGGQVGIGMGKFTTLTHKFTVEGATQFSTAGGGSAYSHIPYTNGEVYLTGDLDGTGNGDVHIRVWDSVNSYVEYATFVGATQRLGIGTGSPAYKLHVRDNSGSTDIWVQDVSPSSDAGIRMGNDTQQWRSYVAGSGVFAIRDITGGGAPFIIEKGVSTNTMRLVSGDFVGVGLSVPQFKLDVYDNNPTNGYVGRFTSDGNVSGSHGIAIKGGQDTNPTHNAILFQDGNGTTIGRVNGNGAGGVNYNSSSDERRKEGKQPFEGVWEQLDNLRAITYTGKGSKNRVAGALAQDFQDFIPGVVSEGEDGFLTMDYGRAALVLGITGLKEAKERIIALENRIAELENA